MKKYYLISTRNLYYTNENGLRVFYSYSIPIAFQHLQDNVLRISENVWSITTAKHLNWVEDFVGVERKTGREPNAEFKKNLDNARGSKIYNEQVTAANNQIKTAATVSKLFGLLCDKDNPEIKHKYQKRYFEIAGLSFPDDWDELSSEEKDRRLNKVINMNIGGISSEQK